MGNPADRQPLPWHQPYWEKLLTYIEMKSLPHALLITGSAGLGKSNLAMRFARLLLCECTTKRDQACGCCKGCRLIEVHSHPDLIYIEPDAPGKSILVDRMRVTIAALSLAPHYGEHRIIILDQAHQLNKAAANSILKTLEEPADGTILILVTHMPSRLPLTIISRCQRLVLTIPDREIALKWLRQQNKAIENPQALLNMARGGPLNALVLANQDALKQRDIVFKLLFELAENSIDPVSITEKCGNIPDQLIINLITFSVVDMIRIAYHPGIKSLYNPDLRETLQQLVQRLNLKQLFSYLDLVYKAKARLYTQVNSQLLLEELFVEWCKLTIDFQCIK